MPTPASRPAAGSRGGPGPAGGRRRGGSGAAGTTRIGVLAVQGGFAAHVARLADVGAGPVEVRTPADFDSLDGLILPGGESTTILKGIAAAGLEEPIRKHAASGGAILGTCAGMIVAGSENLGLIHIRTRRNAFGRQLASFEDDVEVAGVEGGPVRAVFIRAPWIESAGPGVSVLATVRGRPVAAREGAVTVLSFHPELTGDLRIHTWFAAECADRPQAG